MTLSDTTLSAARLNDLDSLTTGVINASTLKTITGTAADIAEAYDSYASKGISGLGNAVVELSDALSDATAAAAHLNAIDAATT